MRLVIGIVTGNTSDGELELLANSLRIACEFNRVFKDLKLLLVDNSQKKISKKHVTRFCIDTEVLDVRDDFNFVRALNLAMQQAFQLHQANAFFIAHPQGAFHWAILDELGKAHLANPDALIEATLFPDEHPKMFDPITLHTDVACDSALLVTKTIYETIGGFDERFARHFADVDFSWRIRAAGIRIVHCPAALYFHSVAVWPNSTTMRKAMLMDGRQLASKWGSWRFRRRCEKALRDEFGLGQGELPSNLSQGGVTAPIRRVRYFDRDFRFARLRWD